MPVILIFQEKYDIINLSNPTKIRNNSVSTDIFLEDISNKGYEVSSWVQLADITVKILPVYTNSRIFIVQCSGPENSVISASFKAFDADGNSIRSVSSYSENGEYFLAECDQTLPGDVCRIEIENLRVRVNITNPSEFYKIEPDQIFPLPLWSCPLFKETAMAYDGENFKTVIEVNSSYTEMLWNHTGLYPRFATERGFSEKDLILFVRKWIAEGI